MQRFFLIAMCLLPALALAEQTPQKGPYDPRVRVVDYNPLNVVRLSTFYGVSTHVQFADGEKINDVAVGDDLAWKVVPRGNHLFIKPQQTRADTNVTVVTSLHTYQFALVVQPRPARDAKAWADPNLIFSLTFRYPEEEAARRAASAGKEAVDARLGEARAAPSQAGKDGRNRDYWVAGSDEISPTAAHDDGRFIFLTFSRNRDMPAVYAVDAQGHEALVNTSVVDGNTIVVQRLVPRLILRKGDAVASVINKSFNPNGGKDNLTGTVAPDVERVIKGAK